MRKSLQNFKSRLFGSIYADGKGEGDDGSESETEEKRDHWKLKRWEDLILHDDEGKPYIDVNKLVYAPKQRKSPPPVKWNSYIPDYLFFLSNLFGEMVHAFVFTLGLELSVWGDNIQAIMEQHQPKPTATDDHSMHRQMGHHDGHDSQNISGSSDHDDHGADSDVAVLRFEGFEYLQSSSSHNGESIGIFLISFSCLYTINLFLGCWAYLKGYKWGLILHIVLEVVIVLIQCIVSVIIIFGSRCEPRDLTMVKHSLDDMVRIWALPRVTSNKRFDHHYAMLLLDQVQTSLQCCGSSNWTDYVNDDFIHSKNFKLDSGTGADILFTGNTRFFHIPGNKAFPYSCCKPWWVRNIHCSENVHEWAFPNASKMDRFKFRERISQVGCVPQIWSACLRLLHGLSRHLYETCVILVVILAVKIFATVWELKKIYKKSQRKTFQDFMSEDIPTIAIPRHWEQQADDEEKEKQRKKTLQRKSKQKSRKSVMFKDKDVEKGTRRSAEDSTKVGEETDEDAINPYKLQLNELKAKVHPPKEDEINYVRARTPFSHFEIRMGHTRIGHLIALARDVMDETSSHRHRGTSEFFVGTAGDNASLTGVQRESILEEFELLEDKQEQDHPAGHPKGAQASEFNWMKSPGASSMNVGSKPGSKNVSLQGYRESQKKRRGSATASGAGETLFRQSNQRSSWKEKMKNSVPEEHEGSKASIRGTQANTNVSANKTPRSSTSDVNLKKK